MDLTLKATIKDFLLKYETKASKGLGQNFLVDKNVLEKIILSAEIKPTDLVLEVGPGLGVLTLELASRAGEVVAIEKDKTMCNILTDVLKVSNVKNVEIINTDILKHSFQKKNYKVVANIPYYLTSPLIRKFLESQSQPKEIILMIQKEVAQRICSVPPNMSLLAVAVQFYANAKILFNVSKNSFWPAPKIDSAVIKIVPDPYGFSSQVKAKDFFAVAKAGFSHPRKQLVNNLTSLKTANGVKLDKDKIINWLLKNNIKPSQRAETLSVSEWIILTKTLNK